MPDFEFTSPEGKTYRVSGPEGATKEQAFSILQGQLGQQQPSAPSSYGEEMSKLGGGLAQIGGSVDDLVRQAAKGATFGQADRIAAFANSLFGSQGYSDALKQEQQRTGQFAQQHPIASGIAEAAGGLGTGGALVKSGATLYNVAKELPLALRGGALATEGAAYGAAQGAGGVTDGSAQDYASAAGHGALAGAALGAGLPVAGAAIGAGYRAVAPFASAPFSNLSRGTAGLLETATAADRTGLENISKLGPQGLLADVGPSFTGLAQGVAGQPGLGRSALVRALEQRDVSRNQRLASDISANLGVAQSPSATQAAISDARKTITRPLYQQALDNAPDNIDITKPLATIGEKLNAAKGPEQSALLKARDWLQQSSQQGIPTATTNAQELHNAKEAIDSLINYGDPTIGLPSAVARQQGSLKQVRGQLNEALQQQVPGYKEANQKWAEYQSYIENIDKGKSVLEGGKEAVWPTDFAQHFASLTPEQQSALRLGIRGDIEARLGTQANDLAALKKTLGGELDWNRAKMATAFGEQPTSNVLGAVGREQQFAQTFADVARNSQTQPRAAAASLLQTAEPTNVPIDTTLTGLGLRGAQALGRAIRSSIAGGQSGNIRDELGNILSMPSSPQRDALVKALLSRADTRQQVSDIISGGVGNPALANALLAYGR